MEEKQNYTIKELQTKLKPIIETVYKEYGYVLEKKNMNKLLKKLLLQCLVV